MEEAKKQIDMFKKYCNNGKNFNTQAEQMAFSKVAELLEKQEKIIELMADKITHYKLTYDGVNTRPATREEKIEYFEKKASENDEPR